ncbi:MAG: fumarylacetoacetate hydrolase family protein [Microvirga sp.]|nr:fumarylacetoacetate hydrolase family protein [Microvirga sp.]
MRFATINERGEDRVAVISEDGELYWTVAEACPEAAPDAQVRMASFIAGYDDLRDRLATAVSAGGGRRLGSDARLRAPIPRPARDIICVGKNYYDHAREFTASGYDSSAQSVAQAIPTAPIVFGKSAASVIGPHDAIMLHPGVDEFIDYEAELAVVIGKPGRNVRKENALDHVFGYTIVNDVTARDLQGRHKQWYLAKSLDTSCPMGPWIVTADAFDLAGGHIRCWVDGELRQEAPLAGMIFDIPTLIEVISAGMRLEPGDVIATGTPAGVALSFEPPRYLKDGAEVEIEVSSIGRLSNGVRGPAGDDHAAQA